MDIIVFLGVMIQWPWLALVPACAFALAWVRCRRASILVAAIAWLASIPKRFLPLRVKDEETFASLRARADFQALFQP